MTVEMVGLILACLVQLVIVVMTFQSLRERVKVLEEKVSKLSDSHEAIVKIEAKLDIIISFYRKAHEGKAI